MKVLKFICKILLLILAVAAFILALATLVPQIPFAGSIANYITVHFAHIFLPTCAGAFVLATVFLIFKRRSVLNILTEVLLVLAIAGSACAYGIAVKKLNDQGGEINVLASYKKEDFSMVKKETKEYAPSVFGGSVSLDVYYTEEGKEKPVLFYIHGGGWISGSKNDHSFYLRSFVKKGYLAVSVDYDLSTKDKHLVSSCEEQIAKAVLWVKKNAKSYNADENKLFFLGDSAGGNLALDLAYKINADVISEADGESLPKVKSVCALYPVAEPKAFYENGDLVLGKAAKQMSTYYTGYTPEENAEIYESITPKNFLSVPTPPTLLITGAADRMVDPSASTNLYDALRKNGTKTTLITAPYCNHAFDQADNAFGCQAVLNIATKWFEEIK